MNTRTNKRACLSAVLLLGGLLAVTASVDAATPWFRPGGFRPVPQGDASRDRASGRDRENGRDRADRASGRERALYREQNFIRQLYQGFLNRQPSPNELRVWSDRLGRDTNPTALVQEFMDSDEFFVRETYRGLLGREPDPSGMNTYLRVLEDGQSRADVVEALLSSDEFRNRVR